MRIHDHLISLVLDGGIPHRPGLRRMAAIIRADGVRMRSAEVAGGDSAVERYLRAQVLRRGDGDDAGVHSHE
jgi:hypothetical protein